MNARDRLRRASYNEEFIDLILNGHAHELAGMIRREADDLHQTEPGVVKGLRVAADLIDPEVP